MLKRKIDSYLKDWKQREHKPLIIKGARQIGKTTSIRQFGKSYPSFIEINFMENPEYKSVFQHGYDPNRIIKELSLLNPEFEFIPYQTLILLDEIQEYPDATTSLKFFKEDGKYDVICSGSMLGIHYKKVSSISVGYKEDVQMYSMDFEEFLWANGYNEENIEFIYSFLKELKPLPDSIFQKLSDLFQDYIFCGGMPEIVDTFIKEKTFSNIFSKQNQLHSDYENDITKYVEGLDYAKVLNVYRHITSQLSKENHKFQISKLGHGARSREYTGCQEWLKDAGMVNISYCLNECSFPFSAYEDYTNYRMYYSDTSLLMATLDDESKKDVRINRNFRIYSGAIYENLVAEALTKLGYSLYFYRNKESTIELDFIIRVKNEIIPIEVKANRGRSRSLNTILENPSIPIHYGVKLTHNNIGFDGSKFTIPYFLTFLIKRFFDEYDGIQYE